MRDERRGQAVAGEIREYGLLEWDREVLFGGGICTNAVADTLGVMI